MTAIHIVIHGVLLLLVPPLLQGIIVKVKALFAGRVGAPLWQPYYDLAKLWRKGSVFSSTTTWVFRAGPVVGVATALLAGLLVPLGWHAGLVTFQGDLIAFAYLFALGRFFTILAALDTGSAFEGMGAAREATFSALAEPALFLGLLVLARMADSLSLSDMLIADTSGAWLAAPASMLLVAISFFIVLLAENSRIPFDDPNTHLELTMIHEVMVLDHSGPGFALISYGAALKLFVVGAVIMRLVVPVSSGNEWLDWLVFLGSMAALAVLVAIVESVMARVRLPLVPNLLVAACLLSAFGVVLVAR